MQKFYRNKYNAIQVKNFYLANIVDTKFKNTDVIKDTDNLVIYFHLKDGNPEVKKHFTKDNMVNIGHKEVVVTTTDRTMEITNNGSYDIDAGLEPETIQNPEPME